VRTTEELHERKSSGSGLKIREYGRGDPSHLPHGNLYLHKRRRQAAVIHSRTQATEGLLRYDFKDLHMMTFSDPGSFSQSLATHLRGAISEPHFSEKADKGMI
jgi:hypothetical protein